MSTSTSRVYCLLITHDNTVDGQGFRVDVDPNDDVIEFKNKVMIAVPEAVVGYSPRILQVYRCPETIFDDTDPQKLQEQVNQAMSFGGNARLCTIREIVSTFPTNETLVVKIPEPSDIPSLMAVNDQRGKERGGAESVPLFNKLHSRSYEVLNYAPSHLAQHSTFTHLMKPDNVGSAAFKFNEPIDPTLTPLSLLSDIFGRFKSNMRIEIETEEMFADFKASRALITGMSYLYPMEDDRRRFLINWIVETYGGRLETMVDETRAATDGHFVHTRAEGGNEYLIVLLEGERGDFSPGEPHIQGMAYYRKFYRKRIGSSGYVTRGCMPALLLTYQGCYLDASGLVMHPDGTVQMEPLWGTRLNYDWHSDFERGLIARFIWSVRNCIKDMKMFYDSKNAPLAYYQLEYQPAASEPNAPPPTKKQKLDQFLFYYPCYRETNSGIKTFQYIRRLHNDRLLFLAIEDGSRKQLLVKFSKRYATKVHDLLASAEPALAPKLYACEDLPGGWKWR